MTPYRQAIVAHLHVAPLYLFHGYRIEADGGGFVFLRLDADMASQEIGRGSLGDCLKWAAAEKAL